MARSGRAVRSRTIQRHGVRAVPFPGHAASCATGGVKIELSSRCTLACEPSLVSRALCKSPRETRRVHIDVEDCEDCACIRACACVTHVPHATLAFARV